VRKGLAGHIDVQAWGFPLLSVTKSLLIFDRYDFLPHDGLSYFVILFTGGIMKVVYKPKFFDPAERKLLLIMTLAGSGSLFCTLVPFF